MSFSPSGKCRDGGLCVSILFVLWASSAHLLWASPQFPRLVVNRVAKQCATIIPGDECGHAVLPPDWTFETECPAAFTVTRLSLTWVGNRSEFCCTEGHSGVQGDCKDVAVNRDKSLCCLVNDLGSCARLPDGWVALGRPCPFFSWVAPVPCVVLKPTPSPAQSPKPKPTPRAARPFPS